MTEPLQDYELRIHGVSGTPPESMLGVPAVKRVAGDTRAGFYRRQDPDGTAAEAEPRGHLVEAYSWGGLTSGGSLRALWLLLAPFTLLNVAFHMVALPLGVGGRLPAPAQDDTQGANWDEDGDSWSVTRAVTAAALRLLALTLTLTVILAAAVVCLDVVGWQYPRGGKRVGWLFFLSWSWVSPQPGRLVLTSLFPLLLLLVLAWLSRQTGDHLEDAGMPLAPGANRTPLEDRLMFHDGRPLQRLRALHVSAALALLTGVLLLPLWVLPNGAVRTVSDVVSADPWSALTSIGAAALLGTCVVLLCRSSLFARREGTIVDRRSRLGLLTLLGFLLLLAAWWRLLYGPLWTVTWPNGTADGYPGMPAAVQTLIVIQLLLVGVLLACSLVLRWRAMRGAFPQETVSADGTDAQPVSTAPAWLGAAAAVLALLAVLGTAGAAAGVAFVMANLLGSPIFGSGTGDDVGVQLPPAYAWVAAAGLATAAVAGLLALLNAGKGYRQAKGNVDSVRAFYRHETNNDVHAEKRLQLIARSWGRASLDDVALRLVGVLAAALALITVVATVLALLSPQWVVTHADFAIAWGTAVLVAAVVGLLKVGRSAYRDVQLRRKVGILWDLATFWPRAAHPLAPPCYMERATADLLTRLGTLPDANTAQRILISTHSQGTVIGAALVMQLETSISQRVVLLTYGSPLRRLYARFFPAYFNTYALGRLGQYLSNTPWEPHTRFDDSPGSRATWRWRNLHRSSDPIGGPIFARCAGLLDEAERADDVDWWVTDPRWDSDAGDPAPPPVLGHSDYQLSPEYERACQSVPWPRPGPPCLE